MAKVLCGRCLDEFGERGAFLPGAEADLVCLPCFKSLVGKTPLPEETQKDELVVKGGVQHKSSILNRPRGKRNVVVYQVEISKSSASRKVIKKTMKKNILTLKNLPPGNYTSSYRIPDRD